MRFLSRLEKEKRKEKKKKVKRERRYLQERSHIRLYYNNFNKIDKR